MERTEQLLVFHFTSMNDNFTSSPKTFVVTMRDGTCLSGELWLPPVPPTSLPLLICRTADSLSAMTPLAQQCVALGYPVYLQSVRGRGDSSGQFRPYVQEASDGEDTLRQLLDNSNLGAFGILPFGFGYSGQTALALALRTPSECLVGLALIGATASHFESGICCNGLIHGEALFSFTRWLPVASRPTRAEFAEWLVHPHWQTGFSPFSAMPPFEEWVLALRANPIQDAFWQCPALCPKLFLHQLPKLPIFICGGTASLTGAGTFQLAKILSAHNTADVEFWMGNWDDEAFFDYNDHSPICQHLMEWFTQIAMKKTPRSRNPRNINYLIQEWDDDSHWLHWTHWPILDLSNQELFLQPSQLTTSVSKIGDSCEYYDNPHSPPTLPPGCKWGLTDSQPLFGPFRLPPAIRADTLSFTSAPFPHEKLVVGQPRLRLRVSTNRLDTLFLARLVAIPPATSCGDVRTIAYGAYRLSLRYGLDNLVAFSPGTDHATLTFSLTPTIWHLPAGSQLRLELSSNDFPRYLLGTNDLPPIGNASCPPFRIAHNTIECDIRGTSRLTLPVLNKAPP